MSESQEQIKYLIAIGTAAFSVAVGFMGYIIKVMRKANADKLDTMRKANDIDRQLTEQGKDIEYLKKENYAIQKEIELMGTDIKGLQISQAESIQILKDVKRDVETMLQRSIK